MRVEGGTDPLTSLERRQISGSNWRLFDESHAGCRPPGGLAAGQRSLFNARNDGSSLYKRQKGQSPIDTCEHAQTHTEP